MNDSIDFQSDRQSAVKKLVEETVEPGAAERSRIMKFPYGIIKKLGKMGILGTFYPVKYGGSGSDFISYVRAMEDIASSDLALHGTLQPNITGAGMFFLLFGTEDQKRKYLPPMLKGDALGSLAMTELEAGSDGAAISTTAKLSDGKWVLNGKKEYVINSGTDISSGVVVLAVSGTDTDGIKQNSIFYVPKGSNGYVVEPQTRLNNFVGSSVDAHTVRFEDCCIPEENIIGRRGDGLKQVFHVLDYPRITMAAGSVGVIRRCLEESTKHAKSRRQFGKAIFDHQVVQFKLADMALNLELSRLITYKAAVLVDEGKAVSKEAAYAKLFASEAAEKAASDAVQIFGGRAFLEECPLSRFYGSVKLHSIGDGTSEVMRLIIAKHL